MKSVEVSLEYGLDLLPALSRGDRFGAHLFASLLVIAANDCRSATSDLAHHAAWRSGVRLGTWRRDIFRVVTAWRVPGARRRVDDLPKRRSGRAGDPGRLDWARVRIRKRDGIVSTFAKWRATLALHVHLRSRS